MKRVLIISYYWPPSGGAGVQRWLKFVKYLRLYGWEPVVFCPENPEYPEYDNSLERDIPNNLEVIKFPIWEPYHFYKRLLGQKKDEKISAAFLSEKKKNPMLEAISIWIRGNFFIPDARKFWIRPSVNFLGKYLIDNPVDAIVSTGPPHSTHLIAMQLADQYKRPWLADFRDPWTNIDFYKDLKLTRRADALHRKLELKVLQNASAVTVISHSMADDFKKLFKRGYAVITNGYDETDTSRTEVIMDKKFSIAHIGSLVSTRNPITLWEVLKAMLASIPSLSRDLEIKLVGKVDFSVMASLESFGLDRFVRKIDYLPHDEVIQCQQQSQVLLLIINNTPNAKMILTGKFFEYLSARRPILCLGPEDGDAAKILTDTRAGFLAGFGDVATMQKHVLHLYEGYLAGNLSVNSTATDQYSRKELTRQLAKVLDDISATGVNPD